MKKILVLLIPFCLLTSIYCTNAAASSCLDECENCGPDNPACSLVCGVCSAAKIFHHHH